MCCSLPLKEDEMEKLSTKDVFVLGTDGSAYVLLLQANENPQDIFDSFQDPENLELLINYELPVICLKSQKDLVIKQMNELIGIMEEQPFPDIHHTYIQ